MTEDQYKVEYTTSEGVISAFYDDEFSAEKAVMKLLGTTTRSGALISGGRIYSPEGKLVNEFEY